MTVDVCCGTSGRSRWVRDWLKFIRELGFEVDVLRELLELVEKPQHSCAQVDALAREHLKAILNRIEHVEALKAELESVRKSSAKGRISNCRIIDVLSHHEHCIHETH